MTVKGGAHLGAVRRWIQRKANNGDTVIWGSSEVLQMTPLTADDMDHLAQEIRDAVVREILDKLPELQKCKKFEPWGGENKSVDICNSCGFRRALHEECDIIFGEAPGRLEDS